MSVTIQLRWWTASEWSVANPILAEREMGVETDTKLYKIGDGTTAWNALPYTALRQIDEATILNMSDQAIPATPDAGTMNFFAKSMAGRMLPRVQWPSGVVYPLQPSFFQNNIFSLAPSTTTVLTALWDSHTAVGTISHPLATEAYWRMANFASAATAGTTCWTGSANLLTCTGSVANWASGFFYQSRFALPDSSYNQTGASTGSRVFSGLTNATMAVVVGLDLLAISNSVWFFRTSSSVLTHINWQFTTRNSTAQKIVDTGLPFIPQKVYDVFIFCPPNWTTIWWRIDNVTDWTTASWEVSETLPVNTEFMRCGTQLCTINALSRHLRIQKIYLETDR